MPSLITSASARVARLVTRSTAVQHAEAPTPNFRTFEIAAPEAGWSPGCKVQFHVDGRRFRTYTPFGWDGRAVSFLAYRHDDGDGGGPANAWLDQIEAGGTLHMFGPRGSLRLADLTAAPVVVGDETSFAVAAAWDRHGATPAAAHVFEVTAPDESRTVLDGLDLSRDRDDGVTLVPRAAGDGHHGAMGELVVEALRRHPDAPLVCTGKAQTIRAVRGAVKDAGLSPPARVKAYWDPNRSGLD